MASRSPKDDAAASAICDIERTLTALRSRIKSEQPTAGSIPIVSATEEPTAPESQPSSPASAEPTTTPNPKSETKDYDGLGAHIEMADQRNRIRESDVQFRKFLRQRPRPVEPSSDTPAGHDEASFLHPTSARPADTEAAIREALAQQGDPGSSISTDGRIEYKPQAQEWDPHGHDEGESGQQGGGSEDGQGQSLDPKAKTFRPSGEQVEQAGTEHEH